MIDIMIDLQGGAKAPLYEKIYEYIKQDITAGKIPKGEKLPSTRLLARHLEVSRSTVEMAYEQLLAEGYIKAEPCRGFFACDFTELYQLEGEVQPVHQGVQEKTQAEVEVDFSPYAIDAASFPFSVWRKLNRNMLLDDREELLYAGDGQGDYGLRSAIASYLHQARGVNCSAADIVIGAGNEYLELLLIQLLGRDKTVLMEEPGYPQAYHTFCNAGCRVQPAGSLEEDLLAEGCRNRAELIYVMPSHQFPTGNVMPLKQRLLLLKWASEAEERYIIEDDHDSEYRYRGKPIPSLQSIDRYGKVIYIGTFSKSIAPSLRISYMVLPRRLMERYHGECGFYSATVPRMQQEVLRAFITEGHFERHLNKMRGIYRSKHDFLLGELKKKNWAVKVSGDHAGLHVLVEVDSVLKEQEICQQALLAGVKVSGMSEYFLTDAVREQQKSALPVLLLGYGKLNEKEMKHGLHILDTIVKGGYKNDVS